MATPTGTPEARASDRLSVIMLVAAVDRRILPALRFVSQLRQADVRALHIALDPERAGEVAKDWMRLDLSFVPLHIKEPRTPALGAAVRAALLDEVERAGPATVVLPEFEHARWWHPLLHRQSARFLAVELQGLPGVSTVIVPFVHPGAVRAGVPSPA